MSGRDLVTVRVPEPLREFTGGRGQLHYDASTVDAVLEQIRRTEPLLAGRLFEDDGSVRGFINVFVDGRDLRHLAAGRRQVRPGSVVAIVPSVAGG
ncbi:MAG: MoaD/ThiS family protein [marine benthic group bacterium]|nr:MoaD/ThiS family protein [Gemmatimonadota bacterium]